jgi:hypothetical protein
MRLKLIATIIGKIATKDAPTPLGRWRIETSKTLMNNKVDLSNEDHCGPCGQYMLDKAQESGTKDAKKENLTK